jgi:hypothetical protein
MDAKSANGISPSVSPTVGAACLSGVTRRSPSDGVPRNATRIWPTNLERSNSGTDGASGSRRNAIEEVISSDVWTTLALSICRWWGVSLPLDGAAVDNTSAVGPNPPDVEPFVERTGVRQGWQSGLEAGIHERVQPEVNQLWRCHSSHNPWVVGSSPTRPTTCEYTRTQSLHKGATVEYTGRYHSGDLRLSTHMSNATVKMDNRGTRIYKEHKHSSRRIDLAVCSIMSHSLAAVPEPGLQLFTFAA